MPLTNKGEEIMNAMQKQYGAKKGESVFYASNNKGNISGVDMLTTPGQEERTRQAFIQSQAYRSAAPITSAGVTGMDGIGRTVIGTVQSPTNPLKPGRNE